MMPILLLNVLIAIADDGLSGQPLSIDQTLSLLVESGPLIEARHNKWHLYQRASPLAREHLRSILHTAAAADYRPAAIRMLAFVGDEQDAGEFGKMLSTGFQGVLVPSERLAVQSLFDALGVMARRGNARAISILQQMVDPKYWINQRWSWYGSDFSPGVGTQNMPLVAAMEAYLLAGVPDANERTAAAIDAIEDSATRGAIRRSLQRERVLTIGMDVDASLSSGVTDDDLKAMERLRVAAMSIPVLREAMVEGVADAKHAAPGNDVVKFLSVVRPSYRQLRSLDAEVDSATQENNRHRDDRNTPEARAADEALAAVLRQQNGLVRSFDSVVSEHWPFPLPDLGPRLAAIDVARRFEQEEYIDGDTATRRQALDRWLRVANKFPGTEEHDEALFRAAMLYLQRFMRGANYDADAAQRLLGRLADRPGPPSRWTVVASENRVSFANDPATRLERRSEYLARLREMSTDAWFEERALVPSPLETPETYRARLESLAVALGAVRKSLAENSVYDARLTDNPFGSVRELQQKHAGDEVVSEAIRRGGMQPRLSGPTRLALSLVCASAAILLLFLLQRRWRRSRT